MPSSDSDAIEGQVGGLLTRHLLLELGFTPVQVSFTDLQPGYRYDFGNLVLDAAQLMGLSFQPEIAFSGVISSKREVGMVQFSLPLYVEDFEHGVALIAHYLGPEFKSEVPTDWLDKGRQWQHKLPWRRNALLYAQRPQCHVEADWFRVALKKLIQHGSQADETQVFKVSFKAGVLKFELSKQSLAMPATGDDWQVEYISLCRGLATLSKRTPADGVWLGVWKNELEIGRNRLSVSSTIETNLEPSP